jgi:hypothetical protein
MVRQTSPFPLAQLQGRAFAYEEKAGQESQAVEISYSPWIFNGPSSGQTNSVSSLNSFRAAETEIPVNNGFRTPAFEAGFTISASVVRPY